MIDLEGSHVGALFWAYGVENDKNRGTPLFFETFFKGTHLGLAATGEPYAGVEGSISYSRTQKTRRRNFR